MNVEIIQSDYNLIDQWTPRLRHRNASVRPTSYYTASDVSDVEQSSGDEWLPADDEVEELEVYDYDNEVTLAMEGESAIPAIFSNLSVPPLPPRSPPVIPATLGGAVPLLASTLEIPQGSLWTVSGC